MMKTFQRFAALVLFMTFLSSPTPAVFAEKLNLNDGVFEVTEGLLTLKVTVKDGKFLSIEVLEHRGQEQYLDMVRPLIDQIITEQNLGLDGVTGATLSSTDLINALKQLLTSP